MDDSKILMQLMDDLALLNQTAKDLQSPLYGAIVTLKIAELQGVLGNFLTVELE